MFSQTAVGSQWVKMLCKLQSTSHPWLPPSDPYLSPFLSATLPTAFVAKPYASAALKSNGLPAKAMLCVVLGWPGPLPILPSSVVVLASPKALPCCPPKLTPPTAGVGASVLPLCPQCFLSSSSHVMFYLSRQFTEAARFLTAEPLSLTWTSQCRIKCCRRSINFRWMTIRMKADKIISS